ncbi:hypothetical protein [Mariniphaga sediminis]|uniref:hypothetical protein n=1 Tax=Mariniphaga sediminis TaxID=1628158 RepID=UPI003565EF6D
MQLKKKSQTEGVNSAFLSKLLVSITLLFLLISCDSATGPDFKKDKELRLQVKPVMLIENEFISQKDIGKLIDQSTIRRGGYVAIIPTSWDSDNKNAISLQNHFYNRQIEAVHILYIDLNSPIRNTDLLTIENATILCLLDGDVEKFIQMASYPVLKTAILNAYQKGTLLVMNGNACSLANDPVFTFPEESNSKMND